jgi:hypothetical protein
VKGRTRQLANEWLKPINRQINDQIMSGPYIQVDKTPIKYQEILADCLPILGALATGRRKEHFLFSGKIRIVYLHIL